MGKLGYAITAIVFLGVLYGPRLGWLDSALISGVLGAGLLRVFSRHRWSIAGLKPLVNLSYGFIAIAAAAALNGSILYAEGDPTYFLAKTIRVGLIVASIYILLQRAASSSRRLVDVLAFCLGMNLVTIYLQILSPDLKAAMAPYVSPVINVWVPYRAQGLTNSYDVAGMYVVNFLAIMLHIVERGERRAWYFRVAMAVLLAAAMLATLFTARVAFVSMLAMLAYWAIRIKGLRLRRRLVVPAMASLAIAAIFLKFLISKNPDYFYAFYRSIDITNFLRDSTDLAERFLIWPQDFSTLLIGSGEAPYSDFGGKGDVGYGHLLWGMGLFGLGVTLAIYLYLFNSPRDASSNRNRVEIHHVHKMMVILALVGAMKGPYLLGRGLFETLIMMWMISGRTRCAAPQNQQCAG